MPRRPQAPAGPPAAPPLSEASRAGADLPQGEPLAAAALWCQGVPADGPLLVVEHSFGGLSNRRQSMIAALIGPQSPRARPHSYAAPRTHTIVHVTTTPAPATARAILRWPSRPRPCAPAHAKRTQTRPPHKRTNTCAPAPAHACAARACSGAAAGAAAGARLSLRHPPAGVYLPLTSLLPPQPVPSTTRAHARPPRPSTHAHTHTPAHARTSAHEQPLR